MLPLSALGGAVSRAAKRHSVIVVDIGADVYFEFAFASWLGDGGRSRLGRGGRSRLGDGTRSGLGRDRLCLDLDGLYGGLARAADTCPMRGKLRNEINKY